MSSAVIGSLRVDLSANAAEFTNGLRAAQASLKAAGERMQAVGRSMSFSVTAPLAGLGALTLRTAGNFEASMNRVQAALGAPADTMADLSAAAKEMGRTTQFSASEAGDAIEVLAKNGLDASQILGGALDASLKLAAASGADLASAGDLATDVMASFGKGAGDLGKVVDGVAGVMLASKFGFDDYRLALAQAGGVAGGLGVELAEFNSVIAATSSAFASGSDAGTSFKTFLQRLVPASSTAAAAMQNLGLEFFEADGSMKSMAAIAQELQDKLGGLSQEDLSDNMSTIFGTDAMRTAVGLMKAGSAGIEELDAKIASASASEQAAARTEGLNGALTRLGSAFEALQLAIADSGLLDIVTDIVEGITGLVATISEADPKIVQFGVVFAGLAAAIGPALMAIGAALAVVGGPATLVVAGVAALTAAFVAFRPEIERMAEAVKTTAVEAFEWLQTSASDALSFFETLPEQMTEVGRRILEGLWLGLQEKFADIREALAGFASGLVGTVKDTLGIHSPSRVFQEIGQDMMAGLGLGIQDGAERVRATTGDAFDGIGSEITGPFRSALSEGETSFESFARSLESMAERLRDRLLDRAFAPIEAGLDSLAASLGNALVGAFSGGFTTGQALPGGGKLIAPTPKFNPYEYASGTNFHPGGMAIVGEEGPELLDLPRGSRVIPNDKLSGGGGGGGSLGTLRVALDAGLIAEMRRASADDAGRIAVEITDNALSGPKLQRALNEAIDRGR